MNNGDPLPAYIDGGDGTEFARSFVQLISPLVTDPLGALKLLLHESGLNPAADNGSYVGINQLAHASIGPMTGMSLSTYKSLTAAQQLPYAAKFWRSLAKTLPLNPRDLYWTNFLPATVVIGAPDDYVFVQGGSAREEDQYRAADGSWHVYPGVWADNPSLHDPDDPSTITARSMSLALDAGEREHPHLYPYLASMIAPGVA